MEGEKELIQKQYIVMKKDRAKFTNFQEKRKSKEKKKGQQE